MDDDPVESNPPFSMHQPLCLILGGIHKQVSAMQLDVKLTLAGGGGLAHNISPEECWNLKCVRKCEGKSTVQGSTSGNSAL